MVSPLWYHGFARAQTHSLTLNHNWTTSPPCSIIPRLTHTQTASCVQRHTRALPFARAQTKQIFMWGPSVGVICEFEFVVPSNAKGKQKLNRTPCAQRTQRRASSSSGSSRKFPGRPLECGFGRTSQSCDKYVPRSNLQGPFS